MDKHNLELIGDKKVRAVVAMLLEHETSLSDGYGWYCEIYATEEQVQECGGDATLAALANIARDILEAIK